MKVGAENKKQLYAMLVLMAIAVIFLLRMFLSDSSNPTVAASIPNTAPAQPEAANRRAGGRGGAPLDPTLRTDLLRNSEGAEYKGSGRNIFEAQAEIPQPRQPVVPEKKFIGPQPPPPPAPPPPIPLKFFGFANKPGEQRSIFLANGDAVFIGREGDIVNRRYKILHIQSNQVQIEDVLNNNVQTIPLTPS